MGRETKIDFIYHSSNSTNDYSALSISFLVLSQPLFLYLKALVAPVKAKEVVDPTGCGDAWRGALLFGLEKGWPLAKCAALGNRVGALKVAAKGPQNYVLDFDPATFEA